MGGNKSMTVYNTDDARREANKIKAETGHWEDRFLDYYSQEDRRKLASRINDKIKYHKKGNRIDASVCNKESSRGYTSGLSMEKLDEYYETLN